MLARKFNIGDIVLVGDPELDQYGTVEGIGFGPSDPVYYVRLHDTDEMREARESEIEEV